jgi:hypothetical protein
MGAFAADDDGRLAAYRAKSANRGIHSAREKGFGTLLQDMRSI